MKNPQITTKLNRMMADEKAERLSAIACILDHYKAHKPNLHTSDTFDMLYSMDIAQLNDELSDIISEIYRECNKFVTTRNDL